MSHLKDETGEKSLFWYGENLHMIILIRLYLSLYLGRGQNNEICSKHKWWRHAW